MNGPYVQSNRHLFLDGYGSPKLLARDIKTMSVLLEKINMHLFNRVGASKIVAVDKHVGGRPHINNGVSGILLTTNGHFTCHTFSERAVFFADIFSTAEFSHELVQATIESALKPAHVDICTQFSGDGFGRHVVLTLPHLDADRSNDLVTDIVQAIKMTYLCNRSFCWDEDGNSAVLQPIAESHIAVHNVGAESVLDVFSCKDFSIETLLSTVRRHNIEPMSMYTVTRGKDLENKLL